MFKCCGISKPDPLNPPHRGTLNVRTERPELFLSSMRAEIERGLLCFQQLLIKERYFNLIQSGIYIRIIFKSNRQFEITLFDNKNYTLLCNLLLKNN